MSKKISELTETIEPQDNDVLAIINENETKKVKLESIIAKIKTAFNSVYAAITHTHTKSEITDFPTLSNVATSGSYNDLSDKPAIPSAYTLPTASASTLGGVKVGAGLSILNGVLSATGGGVADSVEWANIQNKPSEFTPSTHTHTKSQITDFPTIPGKTSELENDSGYITGYTAGENITIENGVISASGGGGNTTYFFSSIFPKTWTKVSTGTYTSSDMLGEWSITEDSGGSNDPTPIFDGDISTSWNSKSLSSTQNLTVIITCPVSITAYNIYMAYHLVHTGTLSGYNPETSAWETISSLDSSSGDSPVEVEVNLSSNTAYSKFRYVTRRLSSSNATPYIYEFQINRGYFKPLA